MLSEQYSARFLSKFKSDSPKNLATHGDPETLSCRGCITPNFGLHPSLCLKAPLLLFEGMGSHCGQNPSAQLCVMRAEQDNAYDSLTMMLKIGEVALVLALIT